MEKGCCILCSALLIITEITWLCFLSLVSTVGISVRNGDSTA